MEMNDYIETALTCESKDYIGVAKRLVHHDHTNEYGLDMSFNDDATVMRLLHGMIGLETEVGELMDQVKKHLFYGKNLDWINLGEEMGDCMWYIALISDVIRKKTSKDFGHWLQKNIDKLASRYPNKFTEKDATDRDLDTERDILCGE